MTGDIETLLRDWARAYGEGRPGDWEEERSLTGDSPLARMVTTRAPKPTEVAYKRRILPGERAWSRDPLVCTETRTAGPLSLATGTRFSPAVESVQGAWLELRRMDHDQAEVLRLEYQVRMGQGAKAKTLGISRGTYREQLAEARGWMKARLDARQVA